MHLLVQLNLCKSANPKRQKMVFRTDYRLMHSAILRPSLSYHFSFRLRPLFRLFLSGRFTPVLLYVIINADFLIDSSYLVQKEIFISSILLPGLTKEYLSILQL